MTIKEKIESISRALHPTHDDVQFLLDTIAQREMEISELESDLLTHKGNLAGESIARREAEEQRDTGRAALAKYGRHEHPCGYYEATNTCTCGFTASLESTK